MAEMQQKAILNSGKHGAEKEENDTITRELQYKTATEKIKECSIKLFDKMAKHLTYFKLFSEKGSETL